MTERQHRRLAAILAADIAGYCTLMGTDEARTVQDLKAHQVEVLPMITKFGGRNDGNWRWYCEGEEESS